MKKPYEGHEIAYQRMRKEGVLVWRQKGSGTFTVGALKSWSE